MTRIKGDCRTYCYRSQSLDDVHSPTPPSALITMILTFWKVVCKTYPETIHTSKTYPKEKTEYYPSSYVKTITKTVTKEVSDTERSRPSCHSLP